MIPDSPRISSLLPEQIDTTTDGPYWIITATLDIKDESFWNNAYCISLHPCVLNVHIPARETLNSIAELEAS